VHTQTLELVAIQRSTVNLPFQLVTPGRTFLKRGPLLQVLGSVPKEREFLLFSDCVIWLSSLDKDQADASSKWEALTGASRLQDGGLRPPLERTRSKSDADLPRLADIKKRESALRLKLASSKKNIKRLSSGGGEERWIYKGHIDLVDLEIVGGSSGDASEERRLELLSPHLSFALYAGTFLAHDCHTAIC
jgi:FYVE, RhoGEF and PH domain containing 5/6